MRLFLTLVAGPGSYADLIELFDPIKDHFNGICAVYHGEHDDLEAKYLEISKGAGRIVYLPYVGRHDMSRNVALHCGIMDEDCWVMQCDTLERIQPRVLTELVPALTQIRDGTRAYFYFGKPLLYHYHDSIRFTGSPHEGFSYADGHMRAKELSQAFPDEKEIRLNVRPLKRDKMHWVNHYLRYMLLPWGSNHGLLGLGHRGDPHKLFPIREAARMRFIDEMRRRWFPRTVEGFIAMCTPPLDDILKSLINSDKVWVDAYRYNILHETDMVDEHAWTTMVKIP